jgi:hypothetical protein
MNILTAIIGPATRDHITLEDRGAASVNRSRAGALPTTGR